MLPKPAVTRLRFAVFCLIGLILLALAVNGVGFAFSYMAQRQLLEETSPLMIEMERLAKMTVEFGSASRQLERIDSDGRLEQALAHYRERNDQLKEALLNLTDLGLRLDVIDRLKEVVTQLERHEETYSSVLGAKIDARTRLTTLRQEVNAEGTALKDRLAPALLDESLALIEAIDQRDQAAESARSMLMVKLKNVQLLSDISFTAESFVQAVSQDEARLSTLSANTSLERLAPKFRRLTQLILKLRMPEQRRTMAASLKVFEEKSLGNGGVTDQVARLIETARRIDGLDRRRVVMLAEMTDLMDNIIENARHRFHDSAEKAHQNSIIAFLLLLMIGLVGLAMGSWIIRRLIDGDITFRLARLKHHASGLAAGHCDMAIDRSGGDEFAEIAEAMESIRQNIQARQPFGTAGAGDRLMVEETIKVRAEAG